MMNVERPHMVPRLGAGLAPLAPTVDAQPSPFCHKTDHVSDSELHGNGVNAVETIILGPRIMLLAVLLPGSDVRIL
jgi:hypothetical protein